jgi:hypothetical protein
VLVGSSRAEGIEGRGRPSPVEELAAFEQLKPRLQELWGALTASAEEPYTSVVVPSMTLDSRELAKLEGALFYEERLLFLLTRLRNPQARIVYVTSQPVHPLVLEYYLHLLAGIPASHARARVHLICAHDDSPRPLTEKILERPRLIERIRRNIPDLRRAYLTVFSSTPLERRLAVLLGIPLNGVDPALLALGTKSGSRCVFRSAGVPMPEGFESLRDRKDVREALAALARRRPGLRRAVIKLDESFSGEGNAIFEFPSDPSPQAVEAALGRLRFAVAEETVDSYFEKFARMGGVVEEFLEGADVRSPSAQLRIDPRGQTALISTHDQVLGGATGQVYLGCRFPAAQPYRLAISEAAERIGRVLASEGVVSRFGVDFLVRRLPGTLDWELFALEINLRMGGTTHPYLALQFLTGGALDRTTGLFHPPLGRPKYYFATDNLKSDAYRGLCPEDLLEITTAHRLHYDHGTESGVLFHMIGALSQHGKLGVTAIGGSPEEADAIYARAVEVLDLETGGQTVLRRDGREKGKRAGHDMAQRDPHPPGKKKRPINPRSPSANRRVVPS